MVLLTVCVAAYNVEDYLEECLESFMNEVSSGKCEVLIINDGSKDRTSEIADKYSNKFPEIFKHIKKENGGWGSTINTGIQYAQGKYFKQLDGDDRFQPDQFSLFLKLLEQCESDLIYTQRREFDDKTGEYLENSPLKGVCVTGNYPLTEMIDKYRFSMHSITVRTALLKKNHVKIQEKCFYTDVEFLFKEINWSKTIYMSDLPLYEYRLNRDGQSVAREGLIKHYKDHEIALIRDIKYVQKYGNQKYKVFYSNIIKGMIKDQYTRYLLIKPSIKVYKELISFNRAIAQYPNYIKNLDWRSICLQKMTSTYFILGFIKHYGSELKAFVCRKHK